MPWKARLELLDSLVSWWPALLLFPPTVPSFTTGVLWLTLSFFTWNKTKTVGFGHPQVFGLHTPVTVFPLMARPRKNPIQVPEESLGPFGQGSLVSWLFRVWSSRNASCRSVMLYFHVHSLLLGICGWRKMRGASPVGGQGMIGSASQFCMVMVQAEWFWPTTL